MRQRRGELWSVSFSPNLAQLAYAPPFSGTRNMLGSWGI
jgi:hypothetical protein